MDTSRTSEKHIRQEVAGHDARNASLKQLLLNKHVDIGMSRPIDLHFWAAGSTDAEALANELRSRGFTILVQRRAAVPDVTLPWNVEAQVLQSVEFTTGREFTEELVRLAWSHNSKYDGWGTQI